MNLYILAIRNEINILNISLTIIQIKKALNTIYNITRFRGSLTIYADATRAIKMNHSSVFSFITDWVPGLLSNYQRVNTAIMAYKKSFTKLSPFLNRSQLKSIENCNITVKPPAFLWRYERTSNIIPSLIPRFPNISLSVLDSEIWLRECYRLGIPSIQICDTQSLYHKVAYPIIANQRSIVFSHLIVYLAIEVCNSSLINTHLDFLSYFKYYGHKSLNITPDIKKITKYSYLTETMVSRAYFHYRKKVPEKRMYLFLLYCYKIEFKLCLSAWSKKYGKKLKKEKRERMKSKNKGRTLIPEPLIKRFKPFKPFIINKKTYIFNKRNFTYTIKDLITAEPKTSFGVITPYFILIKNILWNDFCILKELHRLLTRYMTDNRIKKSHKRIYYPRLKHIRDIFKNVIVSILGLKEAIYRKNKNKKKYITEVQVYKRDINSILTCSYLYVLSKSNILSKTYLNVKLLRNIWTL